MAKYHYIVSYRPSQEKRMDLREALECFGECNVSTDNYGRLTLEIEVGKRTIVLKINRREHLFRQPSLFDGMLLDIVGGEVRILHLARPLIEYQRAASIIEGCQRREELKALQSKAYAGIADLHFLCM